MRVEFIGYLQAICLIIGLLSYPKTKDYPFFWGCLTLIMVVQGVAAFFIA